MTFYQKYGRYRYKNLTLYDRLNFLIKIFHTNPENTLFEVDIKWKFKQNFTERNGAYKWAKF